VEIFPLTALNKAKSKDSDSISGKTPLIFREIWVFPNLTGNFPFISKTQ
jgi:hypothetical protein